RPRPHRGRHRRHDDDRRRYAEAHGSRRGEEEHRLPPERPERPRRLFGSERRCVERLRGAPILVRTFLPPQPAPRVRQGVRALRRARLYGPQAPSRLAEVRAGRPEGRAPVRDGGGDRSAGPDPRWLRHGADRRASASDGRGAPWAATYPRPLCDGRGALRRPRFRGAPERALRDLSGAGQRPLRALLLPRPFPHLLRVGPTLRRPAVDAALHPRRGRGRWGARGGPAGDTLGEHKAVVPV
ncbi:Uncharacterized protein AVDCRST_MAG82-2682, partial [uncultured Rubrobacteraceae bacterium]